MIQFSSLHTSFCLSTSRRALARIDRCIDLIFTPDDSVTLLKSSNFFSRQCQQNESRVERTNDESDKNQKSVLGWFSWKKNYSSLDTSLVSSLLTLFFEVSRRDKEISRSSLLPIHGEVLNYTLFIEFVFISSEKGIPRQTSVEREANAIRIVGFNRWKNKRWKKKEVSRRRQDELSWKKTSREDSIISGLGEGTEIEKNRRQPRYVYNIHSTNLWSNK